MIFRESLIHAAARRENEVSALKGVVIMAEAFGWVCLALAVILVLAHVASLLIPLRKADQVHTESFPAVVEKLVDKAPMLAAALLFAALGGVALGVIDINLDSGSD